MCQSWVINYPLSRMSWREENTLIDNIYELLLEMCFKFTKAKQAHVR